MSNQYDFMSELPQTGYVYISEIKMYIHPTHVPFVERFRAEIAQDTGTSAHGDLSTRVNYKCTGPLCQKAMRDWAREHRRTVAALSGKSVRQYPRLTLLEQIDPMLVLLGLYHKAQLYGLRVEGDKLAEKVSA